MSFHGLIAHFFLVLKIFHRFDVPNCGTSQVVLVVKKPLANAGDVREASPIPKLGRTS